MYLCLKVEGRSQGQTRVSTGRPLTRTNFAHHILCHLVIVPSVKYFPGETSLPYWLTFNFRDVRYEEKKIRDNRYLPRDETRIVLFIFFRFFNVPVVACLTHTRRQDRTNSQTIGIFRSTLIFVYTIYSFKLNHQSRLLLHVFFLFKLSNVDLALSSSWPIIRPKFMANVINGIRTVNSLSLNQIYSSNDSDRFFDWIRDAEQNEKNRFYEKFYRYTR